MHISRIRKSSSALTNFKSSVMKIDEDVLDRDQWMKNIGAVNECSAIMEVLMDEYEIINFASAVKSFYDNRSDELVKQIERARYQNTKLQKIQTSKQSTSDKWFRQ